MGRGGLLTGFFPFLACFWRRERNPPPLPLFLRSRFPSLLSGELTAGGRIINCKGGKRGLAKKKRGQFQLLAFLPYFPSFPLVGKKGSRVQCRKKILLFLQPSLLSPAASSLPTAAAAAKKNRVSSVPSSHKQYLLLILTIRQKKRNQNLRAHSFPPPYLAM